MVWMDESSNNKTHTLSYEVREKELKKRSKIKKKSQAKNSIIKSKLYIQILCSQARGKPDDDVFLIAWQ